MRREIVTRVYVKRTGGRAKGLTLTLNPSISDFCKLKLESLFYGEVIKYQFRVALNIIIRYDGIKRSNNICSRGSRRHDKFARLSHLFKHVLCCAALPFHCR